MDKAPIALFVYNRPGHTKQVLDALAINHGANESLLYVFCDGPKAGVNDEVLNKIEAVRKVCREETRFKKVVIIEQSTNKGLALSIIEGISKVIQEHKKIIVLEDDIVTSPGFLNYMNDALTVYASEEKVMHVNGFSFPISGKLPKTFFHPMISCWGWATWERAWKHFKKDAKAQVSQLIEGNLWKKFTINGTYKGLQRQLEDNLQGKLNTWAIFWYTTIFLKGGTSLFPHKSLVQNIGFDGSGEHCTDDKVEKNPFHWRKLAQNIEVKRNYTLQNEVIDKSVMNYWKNLSNPVPRKKSLLSRVITKLTKTIKN